VLDVLGAERPAFKMPNRETIAPVTDDRQARPQPSNATQQPSAPAPVQSQDLLWLRSKDGQYLSAWNDGRIITMQHIRSWEWFTFVVVQPRTVCMMTHRGSFVCVEGEHVVHRDLDHDAPPGVEAHFEVTMGEGGGVMLRNVASRGLLSALPTAAGSSEAGGVACVLSGFADGEYVLWHDAKGLLPAVARGEVATAALPAASYSGAQTPKAPSPKGPAAPEIRRNAATGDVVVIAPERLARLRVDPFKQVCMRDRGGCLTQRSRASPRACML
jgi:hypothetical protein